MEPTTVILLGASAVMLVVMPNLILLLSVRRRKRVDDRLTELMDRLSSGHEALETLLMERGPGEADLQEHGQGAQQPGPDLATAREAAASEELCLGQDFSTLRLASPDSSAGPVDPLRLAASAGSEAVQRSVQSLAKAISDRAERQKAQTSRASEAESVRAGRRPTRLRRVRSRLQRCLRRRTVVVLVSTLIASSIAFLVVKPDSTGTVRVSAAAAAQPKAPESVATPMAGSVEAVGSSRKTSSIDLRDRKDASQRSVLDLRDSSSSAVGESLSVSPSVALGSTRRAAELFPELAEGTVAESQITSADHAEVPSAPPGPGGTSAGAPDNGVSSSSVPSYLGRPSASHANRIDAAAPPAGGASPSLAESTRGSRSASAPDKSGLSSLAPGMRPSFRKAAAGPARPSVRRRATPPETDSPAPGATGAGPSPSHGTAASSRLEYNRGVGLFSAHRYREAIGAFRSLVASGLHASLVDNCYYWIGESYFALREFREAKNHFEKVLAMRGTNKALDSRMGLAYCLLELGDTDRAIEELSRVARTTPDGNQAMRARDLASHLKEVSDESDMSGQEVGSVPALPVMVP